MQHFDGMRTQEQERVTSEGARALSRDSSALACKFSYRLCGDKLFSAHTPRFLYIECYTNDSSRIGSQAMAHSNGAQSGGMAAAVAAAAPSFNCTH
jgi:hypothetical protein